MKNQIFPRWIGTIFSYLAAFTYGMYVYGYFHGNKPELFQWIATGAFGLLFYFDSISPKK